MDKQTVHKMEFAFNEESYQRIQKIKELANVNDPKLVHDAIVLYEWYVQNLKDGNQLLIRTKDKKIHQVTLQF